jgi:PAS domain S-box-containing protein
MFGFAAKEMVGQSVGMLMSVPFRDGEEQQFNQEGNGHQPKIIGMGREVNGKRKDGTVFPIDLAVSDMRLEGRRVFTGFVRDITERKQAEKTAREFSGRLLHAQEAERARLARELHDDITQRLARLAIDAGKVEREGPDPALKETMRDLREGLVRLSEDIHALSYRLHPSMLEDLGLAAALRAECDRFSGQTGIQTDLKLIEVPPMIAPEVALSIFRIAQESLRNIGRHAQSKTAQIALRQVDGGLHLAVTDTGIGFDPREHRSRPSLGLASMRERARLVGGELDIESEAGQGTSILAWMPLKGEPS